MTTLDLWKQQLDLAAPYLETAQRRREPMQIVLRIDNEGKVLPPKLTTTLQERQERIQTVPIEIAKE